MRRTVGVGHDFQVAVVGSDHDHIIRNHRSIHNLSEVTVNDLRALDFRLTIGRVADDITVGKVGHEQIIAL